MAKTPEEEAQSHRDMDRLLVAERFRKAYYLMQNINASMLRKDSVTDEEREATRDIERLIRMVGERISPVAWKYERESDEQEAERTLREAEYAARRSLLQGQS